MTSQCCYHDVTIQLQFVVLSEKFSKKEEALRDLQRDYKYKLEEVEKLARVEKEKHDTVEVISRRSFF